MNKFSAMIVDDDKTDRYIMKRFLKKIDSVEEVYEASNGEVALELLKSFNENITSEAKSIPTVLFLDVNMPKMGGFDFLKHYQNLDKELGKLSTVIMMFTSSGCQEDKNKAFSFDCVKDYLEKGNFKVSDLENKINKYCSV